ncbi:MAG: phosphatidate cytidylyltransferase [Bacteroidales bacterium]|nr:phosphatidate cytidylyltransferase [Bacteroidales bacterium]
MNNFFRRTLTGAWIVIFILGGLWLHPVSFFLTGLVLLIGAQYEYFKLVRITGARPQMIPGIITGIITYVISTLIATDLIPVNSFLVLIPVMSIIIVVEIYRKQEKPFDSLAHTFFSVLYAAVPFSMFPFSAFSRTGLNSLLPHGNIIFSPGIIIGFFIILWANDTGAYLSGVSFGRHKMIVRLSPKKTWEGFLGGCIVAALIAWLLSDWLGGVDKMNWVIISVIISVAGTYGDIAESMLKRSACVKDSGSILPGHGGLLDRFDSTILSFPLVYLFILLFG